MIVEERDAEYAVSNIDGIEIRNSQHEDDGRFRRFITTPGGVSVVVWDNFPFDQIATLGVLLDSVAEANYAAGKREAQSVMRHALGL